MMNESTERVVLLSEEGCEFTLVRTLDKYGNVISEHFEVSTPDGGVKKYANRSQARQAYSCRVAEREPPSIGMGM